MSPFLGMDIYKKFLFISLQLLCMIWRLEQNLQRKLKIAHLSFRYFLINEIFFLGL